MLATDETQPKDTIATAIGVKQIDIQEFVLIEEEGETSELERIVDALSAINQLHTVCVAVTQQNPTKLVLLSCDSGSDKSFSVAGDKNSIHKLRELIVDFFLKLSILAERKVQERLKAVSSSLKILEEITCLETEGKISPDDANLLRHTAISSVTKLGECGVMIPQMHDFATLSPRHLMAPEQRLLMAPKIDGSPAKSKAKKKVRSESTQNQAVANPNISDLKRGATDKVGNAVKAFEGLSADERLALIGMLKPKKNDTGA